MSWISGAWEKPLHSQPCGKLLQDVLCFDRSSPSVSVRPWRNFALVGHTVWNTLSMCWSCKAFDLVGHGTALSPFRLSFIVHSSRFLCIFDHARGMLEDGGILRKDVPKDPRSQRRKETAFERDLSVRFVCFLHRIAMMIPSEYTRSFLDNER